MRLMQFKKRTRTFIAVLFAVIFAFCEAIPANAAEITLEKVSAINAVPSGSSVTVTWSETSGAQGYEVQRRFDTTGTYETIGITSDCAYTDNNLALNTVYYYRVRPFASDESGVVYAPYCSGKYVKTDYLEKVVTFEALAEKNGNILSWQEVCDADGYILYSVDSAGNLTKLTQTSALTYTDTSVSEGNIYRYCMRAYKIVEGNYKFGGYSDIVSVTASTFDPLTSPTIISADASGSKVTVAWETVEGANGYILQRKTDINGIYEKIADVTTPYFEDVGLDLNTVYYYRVCAYAVDSDGSIVYSSYCSGKYVKTTYLETVAGLQGGALANGIQLQWDAVYGADGYIIYYINADDSLTKAGQTASVTFTDYSVIAGEVYKYCVRAYTILDGSYKFGGYSAPVEITMPSLETYYDVTRFGADGTDSSPDNDAIQTALNMALKLDDTQKLTVYIPAGTYYLDKSLTIYSNTTLSLDEACTLVRNDASQLMLTAGDKSGQNGGEYTRFTDITIEGGTWDGNASTDSGTKGIIYLFHGENLTLSNFTIKNCCGGHHIELAGIKNATISDVVFRDFIYSEESDDSDNSQNSGISAEALQIDFCSEETAGGSQPYDNTACADIVIERCSFINVLNGVGNHHGDAVSKNITIQGSIFENIANSCINLDATDVFLIADNTASNVNGFLYALSSKGIVRSNVVRGCTDGTASDGNMLTVGLFSSGTAEAPLPEIQIQNNTFTQAGAAAIRLKKGVTATIENNVIEEPKTVGIYLDTTDSVTLNGNTVTGSGEIGIYVKDISMLNIVSNEVNASGVSNILIDNSTATLTENLLENALGNGIAIINSSKVSMERNSISGNGKSGISAKASELTLNGDFIFANKEYGIYLDGALSGTEVAACEISKNTLAGIVCTSGVLSISTSKIFENSGDGIWLFSGGNAEITDCNIFSNSGNGVNIESSSTSHVENCNITDNLKNGVSVSSASSNIYNNFIVRNGIDDSYYDILYKTGSSGAAENNVTGKKRFINIQQPRM